MLADAKELRARTGVLLAASSLAASFLGQQAFRDPSPRGLALTEGLYAFRDDMPEVYRRLAYDLDLFWDSNDTKIKWLTRAYTVAAASLVIEILSLNQFILVQSTPCVLQVRCPKIG